MDAEAVGQGHRHFAAVFMGDAGAFADRVLGKRRVPEIAFEIGDSRVGNHGGLDIARSELDAGAEIGVHRALAVFGHEDHRARGRRMRIERLRFEMHALCTDVVGKDLSELVVGDLAEIGGPAAEAGDTRRRIAGAAAGGFKRRPHARIEQLCPLRIDQVHRTLDDAVVDKKRIVAAGDDIHDRIADREHVEFRHSEPPGMFVSAGVR